MALVINLYGGPGAGKSTIAAEIFAILKFKGLSCELVTEFAKDLVWDKSFNIMNDQPWLFANQHRRITRLECQVDYIVTDSPLLLTLVYGEGKISPEFKAYVYSEYKKMNNLNVFIRRNFDYHTGGRTENKKKAEDIDNKIIKLLDSEAYWESLAEPVETAHEVVEVILHGGDRFREKRT